MSRSLRWQPIRTPTTYGSLWIAVRFGLSLRRPTSQPHRSTTLARPAFVAASRAGPPQVLAGRHILEPQQKRRRDRGCRSTGAIGTQARIQEYSARREGGSRRPRPRPRSPARPDRFGAPNVYYRRRLIDERGELTSSASRAVPGGWPDFGSHHAEQVSAVGRESPSSVKCSPQDLDFRSFHSPRRLSRKYRRRPGDRRPGLRPAN